MIGRLIDDRYEVVSRLGSGRMADVYLGDDRVLGRQVALKVLASRFAEDEQFLERFRREVGRAAGLDHPNIVHVSHQGQTDGTYFVVMEYVEGRSLQAIILEHAPLSAGFLTSVSLQILEALRFAHRRNVFHGNIRPENIIVGGDGEVKVADFSIAQAAQERPAEGASDLHSLGVVMYQMATGRLPIEGDDALGLPGEGDGALSLPGRLEAIIVRSLGLGPVDPYATAQAMIDDLREIEEVEAEAIPSGFAEEAARVMAATAAGVAAGGRDVARPIRADRPPGQQAPIIEPEEQPGRPRRAWPWILVTILILALVATAYAVVSNRNATARPDFGTVPEVVGLPEAKAITKLQDAGFTVRIDGRQPSAEVEEGDVLRQTIDAGIKLEKGKRIGILISSGTGQIAVPDVVGLTQAEAAERLRKEGLEVVAKPEIGSDVEAGRVLRQNPEADKRVDAGATVTITVAAATDTVKVPPLTGMIQESAVAVLKGMDLVADVQETDSQLPGGTVDHQDPASGSEVRQGSVVKIFVSNAPPAKTVMVPAVGALGLTEAEAKAILIKYRLKAKIINLETAEFKPGLCVYQHPVAGAEVKIGSVVNITISRKLETTTTTWRAPPAGATRYDQKDKRVVKTGAWANYASAAAYMGSYGRSSAGGASATIHFTGTRLDWIAMKGTTTGIADVYLDGVKKATITLAASSARYFVNVWSTGNLARGRHEVRIVLSSSSPAGKYLTLDAVDIWGTIRTGP